MNNPSIAANPFGNTGSMITRVGLGGEGVLRTTRKTAAAESVIRTAIAEGISYYDCARVYADSELYYGGIWRREPETRNRIFQASKSASRDKKSAQKDLDDTLMRLGIDCLDLWQIHDVRSEQDLSRIEASGGALEAFEAARKEGKVRFIGVTGHHDPDILTRAVANWPVDSVMMPVNPVEELIGGFLTKTLPAAREKGIAIIGMKIFGAGHYIAPRLGVSAERLLRYALGKPISVAIAGCSIPAEVQVLAASGRTAKPLEQSETASLLALFRENARGLAFYRGVL